MCPDEYKRCRTAQADERARARRELRYVLANRVAMNRSQRTLAALQLERLVAALPPLPPEPYETSTTFPSNHLQLKREYLLLPYYALFFGTIFLLSPVWVPLGAIIECLVKVGLWPYIEKILRYLLLSTTLYTARITFRLLAYFYGAVVSLYRKCTRIAQGLARYIARAISLAVALLLLPSRIFLGLAHRNTAIVLWYFYLTLPLWNGRKHLVTCY